MCLAHREWGRENHISFQCLLSISLTSHTMLGALLISFKPQKVSLGSALLLHFTYGDRGLKSKYLTMVAELIRGKESLDVNTVCLQSQYAKSSCNTTYWPHTRHLSFSKAFSCLDFPWPQLGWQADSAIGYMLYDPGQEASCSSE